MSSGQQISPRGAPYSTKSDHAYRSLREAILEGSLAPGTRIRIQVAARDLGVSDTPVREALKLLESEGLVVAQPHAGYAVSDIGFMDVAENLLLRREVESLATSLSASRLSASDRRDLARLVTDMDSAAERGDWKAYARLNKKFHFVLISRCPLAGVRDLALGLWEAGDRTRRLFAHLTPLEASNDEHRAMLQAIEATDYERLNSLVRSQKTRGLELLLSILEGADRESVIDLINATTVDTPAKGTGP